MKKILYSGVLKFCAFILVCASFTAAVYELVAVIERYCKEENQVYRFEESFDESDYFNSCLWSAGYDLEIAIESYYNEIKNEKKTDVSYGESGDGNIIVYNTMDDDESCVFDAEKDVAVMRVVPVREGVKLFNSPMKFVDNNSELWNTVEKALEGLYNSDVINYYVNVNGKDFSNSADIVSADNLLRERFFLYASRNEKGNTECYTSYSSHYANLFEGSSFSENNTQITFCAAIKEEYANECEALWYLQSEYIREAFIEIIGFAAVFLVCLIYLICVCGKNGKEEKKVWRIDKVWTEVHLSLLFLSIFVPVGSIVIAIDEYLFYNLPGYMLDTATIALSSIPCALALALLLSLVRKAKHGTFFEGSLVFRVMRFVLEIIKRMARFALRCIKALGRIVTVKTGVIYVAMLVFYTTIVFLLGIGTIITPVWLFFAVILFCFACVLMLYRANELERIRHGAQSVRSGNLSHKIENIHNGDLKLLADDINDIAAGLDESVSAKLRAERLKTDLITNVSHDLKTPLTSIISYVELLLNVEKLPDEASDYIGIISKKAQRLKNLTQDLFDISKVQSGNENINLERLDLSLLINQSLGEHDSEITNSGLNFCVDVKNELFVMADGRKMSRVISNLISNILKYSMKNTRVYITAYQNDGKITAEFKNISESPLDFDCEEITGRFVRGDEARSLEGNGLGLAIAKSYTQACGGSFGVVTDGDLFKAVMEFKTEN